MPNNPYHMRLTVECLHMSLRGPRVTVVGQSVLASVLATLLASVPHSSHSHILLSTVNSCQQHANNADPDLLLLSTPVTTSSF